MHDGVEYPLDVLIYATGFQWMATSTFNMIAGRGGRTLSEKWQAEGTRTFLGLHSHGFPNLFIVTGPAGRRRQLQLHRRHRRPRRLRRLDAVRRCASAASTSSTSREEPEDEYAAALPRGRHRAPPRCATASRTTTATATPSPGSLAYYGGAPWHQFRNAAQETLGAVRVRQSTPRSGSRRGSTGAAPRSTRRTSRARRTATPAVAAVAVEVADVHHVVGRRRRSRWWATQ